jgi:hypothetical protein
MAVTNRLSSTKFEVSVIFFKRTLAVNPNCKPAYTGLNRCDTSLQARRCFELIRKAFSLTIVEFLPGNGQVGCLQPVRIDPAIGATPWFISMYSCLKTML